MFHKVKIEGIDDSSNNVLGYLFQGHFIIASMDMESLPYSILCSKRWGIVWIFFCSCKRYLIQGHKTLPSTKSWLVISRMPWLFAYDRRPHSTVNSQFLLISRTEGEGGGDGLQLAAWVASLLTKSSQVQCTVSTYLQRDKSSEKGEGKGEGR